MCCKLLDIPWMNSPAGEYCKKCIPGKRCSIFSTAPQKCLDYKCAYIQTEKVTLGFRPDKCHVIFERISETTMHGLLDPDYGLNAKIKRQVAAFNRQGLSVVISSPRFSVPLISTAEGHISQNIYNEFTELALTG